MIADDYLEEFLEYAETDGIDTEHEDDWVPWFEVWKAGFQFRDNKKEETSSCSFWDLKDKKCFRK